MNLKYLDTFRTIVQTGSFAAAAQKLHYTQSAITFQMRQLERELSVQLFEKVGRSMTLTQGGALLVPYVDDVFAAMDKLHAFEQEAALCHGELHIGVAETLLCYRLAPILKAFDQQAPHAKLYLRSMNCYEIRDELLAGTLDLGIFYQDVSGFGTQLTTYPFGRHSLALVASQQTRERFSDFITPDRSLPVAFIINEKNCIFRQIFERYLCQHAIRLDHTIELWSIPTIKTLVRSNMGVSYLPRFTVEQELESGALCEIPTGLTDVRLSAVCAHHKNKWVSPLMRLFLQLCQHCSTPAQAQQL